MNLQTTVALCFEVGIITYKYVTYFVIFYYILLYSYGIATYKVFRDGYSVQAHRLAQTSPYLHSYYLKHMRVVPLAFCLSAIGTRFKGYLSLWCFNELNIQNKWCCLSNLWMKRKQFNLCCVCPFYVKAIWIFIKHNNSGKIST